MEEQRAEDKEVTDDSKGNSVLQMQQDFWTNAFTEIQAACTVSEHGQARKGLSAVAGKWTQALTPTKMLSATETHLKRKKK